MAKSRQLSMFSDKQVRRSFLYRFTRNPKKEFIKKVRLQNLHGIPYHPDYSRSVSYPLISFDIHFKNRHSDKITKIKNRYFYD